jgi:hypothetical protein
MSSSWSPTHLLHFPLPPLPARRFHILADVLLDVVAPGLVECCTDEGVVHQRREQVRHVNEVSCEQLLLAADGGLDC